MTSRWDHIITDNYHTDMQYAIILLAISVYMGPWM